MLSRWRLPTKPRKLPPPRKTRTRRRGGQELSTITWRKPPVVAAATAATAWHKPFATTTTTTTTIPVFNPVAAASAVEIAPTKSAIEVKGSARRERHKTQGGDHGTVRHQKGGGGSTGNSKSSKGEGDSKVSRGHQHHRHGSQADKGLFNRDRNGAGVRGAFGGGGGGDNESTVSALSVATADFY
mmetsp:Transcript_66982/g.131363  ORF Transcript_66982/g.131363 Transcript_66982/m.131363 type:complete len:185 (+) Transcript_66982:171-725(+)